MDRSEEIRKNDEKPQPSRASRQPNAAITVRLQIMRCAPAEYLLTAGGSRIQISIAEATGLHPPRRKKD